MTPLQELAVVVSIVGSIIAILMIIINAKVSGISKKQDDLCDRIKEEKKDRKESAQEKMSNIKDLYEKVNALMLMQIKSSEQIETILKTCTINHQWDHIDRRGTHSEQHK